MYRINHVVLNLIEGVIRLVLFLLYIWGIGLTKDIQRVFQYHGAEHKTIHTYELDLPLTVEKRFVNKVGYMPDVVQTSYSSLWWLVSLYLLF